jgi:L-ribulokinase
VDGGIIAGSWGYEAGQSAVGDIFAWWVSQGLPAEYIAEADRQGMSPHDFLAKTTSGRPVGYHGLIALDWMGGNRSVLVDHHLSGVIVGLTLATPPEDVYLALLESTAFGTRMIVEAFEAAGLPVTEFIAAGGLKRNRPLMQLYADVLRRPVSIAVSDQAPAVGSAIHAAVAAGLHPDVASASAAMGRVESAAFWPDAARADGYDVLFHEYRILHDYFGCRSDKSNEVLHRLRRLRNRSSS